MFEENLGDVSRVVDAPVMGTLELNAFQSQGFFHADPPLGMLKLLILMFEADVGFYPFAVQLVKLAVGLKLFFVIKSLGTKKVGTVLGIDPFLE